MFFYESYIAFWLLLLGGVMFILIPSLAWADSIPLVLKEPSGIERKKWPVTSGVPLPEGALGNPDNVRLLSDGIELLLQTEILSSWPDGMFAWHFPR